MPLADPDQIGMRAGRAEAGIVRGGDDPAARQHRIDAGDASERIGPARRRAFVGDAGGRMRPRHDRAAAGRDRPVGHDHETGDRDRATVHSRGLVEDARDRRAVDPFRRLAEDPPGLRRDRRRSKAAGREQNRERHLLEETPHLQPPGRARNFHAYPARRPKRKQRCSAEDGRVRQA